MGRVFESEEVPMITPVGFMNKRSSIMLNRLKQAFGPDPDENIKITAHGGERRSDTYQGKGKPEQDTIVTSTVSTMMDAPALTRNLEPLSNAKQPEPRFMALKYDPLMVSTPENNSFRRKMIVSEDEKLMKCFFNPVSCF